MTAKINPSLEKQMTQTFTQLIKDLNDPQKAAIFFKDFFTPSEQNTFIKRLAIAYWLKKGRSYQNIKQNLKVSSATIASVQQMSNSKGFSEALKLIEAEEWANQWSQKIKNFVGK